MSTSNILMLVTAHPQIDATGDATGVWLATFALPYHAFAAAGYQMTVAALTEGPVPIDPHSYPPAEEVEAHQAALAALETAVSLTDLSLSLFDALFLSGGYGAMYDFPSEAVGQVVTQFAAAEKLIAAVDHGAAAFITARSADGTPFVSDKRLTAITNAEETAAGLDQALPFLLETRLRELGTEFIRLANGYNHVLVDGCLITGQNPPSSHSTAQALIRILKELN